MMCTLIEYILDMADADGNFFLEPLHTKKQYRIRISLLNSLMLNHQRSIAAAFSHGQQK